MNVACLLLTASDTCVPSPAELDVEFRTNIRPETLVLSDEVAATFDLEALKEIAARVMWSGCIGLYKIAEGGFNQVFALTFANGTDIIARLGGSRAKQTTNWPEETLRNRVISEVATLKYIRKLTKIPVPEIYAYDENPNNRVRAPYILQQRIIGKHPDRRHINCDELIKQVAHFEGELMSNPFSSIGCIYPDNNTQSSFRIGPFVESRFHFVLGSTVGPCPSSRAYILSFLRKEMRMLNDAETWIERRAARFPDETVPTHAFMQKFYHLLEDYIHHLDCLDDPASWNSVFILRHDDLTLGNILVAFDDPNKIVGVIDWEGATVVPLWSYFIGDFLVNDMVDPPSEQATRLRELRISVHILYEPSMFEAVAKGKFPLALLDFVRGGYSFESVPDVIEEYRYIRLMSNHPDSVFAALDTFVAVHST